MKVIYRFPHGVTINPKEYLLDENNNLMQFIDEESAIMFLIKNGVEDIENYY